MPLLHRLPIAFLLAGLLISSVCRADTLHVEEPWARATAAGAQVGVAYLTLRNTGEADRLLGASSPASASVEVHNMLMQDGRMQMRPVPVLEIPAASTVRLAPGGLHLMLLNLHAPLVEGQRVELTLTFEKAGTRTIQASIAGLGATSPDHSSHHHHH